MDFSLIPTAEASITTLVNSISKVIINPIIIFLFACAVAYFLYGVAQYLMSPDNEEVRKKSKSQIVWGLIGLFIMTAVFGILTLVKNTLGVKNIQIQQSGEVKVNNFTPSSTGNLSQSSGGDTVQNTGSDLQNTGNNLQNTGNNFQITNQSWLSYTGGTYQSTGGTGQSGDVNPLSRSTKNSRLIGKYQSDSSYYRVVDSGVSPVLDEAKKIALNNALNQIAKLKGLSNAIGIKYRVIEQTEFPLDSTTGNYDSFIAVESPIGNQSPSNMGSTDYISSGYTTSGYISSGTQ